MPAESNPEQKAPASDPADGASKKKMKACNKGILLWRLFEHGNQAEWSEGDLRKIYRTEVEPFGFTFCFLNLAKLLQYEGFVKEVQGNALGNRVFTLNTMKIKHFVKNVSPTPPPPANKNIQEVAMKFICVLWNGGSARNPVPIKEEKLAERFMKHASDLGSKVSFVNALNCLLGKRLVARCDTDAAKLVYQVEHIKKFVPIYLAKNPDFAASFKVSSKAKPVRSPSFQELPIAPPEILDPAKEFQPVQKARLGKPHNLPRTEQERKADNLVRQLMRENGLSGKGRQREWSKVTGDFIKRNRATFVNQCWNFGLRRTIHDGVYYPTDGDFCLQCGESFESNDRLETHLDSEQHKFMVAYESGKKSRREQHMPPEEMSGQLDGITVQSVSGEEGCANWNCVTAVMMDNYDPVEMVLQLNVLYETPSEQESVDWILLSVFPVLCQEGSSISVDGNQFPLEIKRDGAVPVMLKIEYSHQGLREYVLAFKFSSGSDTNNELFVMKTLSLRVDNLLDHQGFVSNSKLRHKPKPAQPAEDCTNDAEDCTNDAADYNINEPKFVDVAEFPPLPNNQLKVINRLKDYPLPWQLIRHFNYGFRVNAKTWLSTLKNRLAVFECFEMGLTPGNYTNYFQLLLFLEEHQMLCDLRVYAMEEAVLEQAAQGNNNFYLEVPGLAENRPSVLLCDAIYITTLAGVYKGFVNRVEQSRIRFAMAPSFVQCFRTGMTVNVHFSFNRSSLKVQHRALEVMNKSNNLINTLFPRKCSSHATGIEITDWFNGLIASNPHQKQAVQNIINGTSLPAPFVLFGPPGTGKTVTLVESIKQVYLLWNGSHVLAVAPSNSAADLLAMKILDSIPARDVIRLYSPSRNASQVPTRLRHIANYNDVNECVFPSLEFLMKFRIIVCTMICSGRLYSGNFPPGFFSHIFIDECGHGMEPNALVPIAGLQSTRLRPTQIVISGDPKQLGPIVRSPVALAMGLGDSFLVRLMDSESLYQKTDGVYNKNVLTKLTYNYRSHPQILKVPNELFYDGELEARGNPNLIDSACNLPWLPQKGFPLIFHGVAGRDEQHPSSPSYFNMAEVHEVVKYVRKILASSLNGTKLKQSDIGVVSPYRGQLQKISRSLTLNGFGDVSVGSVEEFQGQERRVIIISTVRSNPAQLKLDQKFSLGFVREPRRFNVAVTRASALLIVIGNPHLLETDPNWRRLLEHIYRNGGYTHTNCPFTLGPPRTFSETNQLLKVQQKLRQQMEVIKNRIQEMEDSHENFARPADIALENKANQLIDNIRKMNYFEGLGVMNSEE